jgi:hypothetical protein
MQPFIPPSSSDTLFGRQFYPVEDSILTNLETDPFEQRKQVKHQTRQTSAMAPPYLAPYGYYPYYHPYRSLPYPYYPPPSLTEASSSDSKVFHKISNGQPEVKSLLNPESKISGKTPNKGISVTVIEEETEIVHV